jgi:ubiquinone biosynthesis protein COQ9
MPPSIAPHAILRERLLDAMLEAAAAEGWNSAALATAARQAGLSPGEVELAAPRGVMELIDAFADRLDRAMVAAIAELGDDLKTMKVREKATYAVRTRIELAAPYKEAARRAAARMALSRDGLLAGKLAWKTADAIWTALGDTSTDGNYYSKRALLAGIYASTLGLWLVDQSADGRRVWDYLDARIENVMQFEKFKATRLAPLHFMAAGFVGELAKMRYGRDEPIKPVM